MPSVIVVVINPFVQILLQLVGVYRKGIRLSLPPRFRERPVDVAVADQESCGGLDHRAISLGPRVPMALTHLSCSG